MSPDKHKRRLAIFEPDGEAICVIELDGHLMGYLYVMGRTQLTIRTTTRECNFSLYFRDLVNTPLDKNGVNQYPQILCKSHNTSYEQLFNVPSKLISRALEAMSKRHSSHAVVVYDDRPYTYEISRDTY